MNEDAVIVVNGVEVGRGLDGMLAALELLLEGSEGVDERSSPGSSSDAPGAATRLAPAPSDT
jgi:hypothetical protein